MATVSPPDQILAEVSPVPEEKEISAPTLVEAWTSGPLPIRQKSCAPPLQDSSSSSSKSKTGEQSNGQPPFSFHYAELVPVSNGGGGGRWGILQSAREVLTLCLDCRCISPLPKSEKNMSEDKQDAPEPKKSVSLDLSGLGSLSLGPSWGAGDAPEPKLPKERDDRRGGDRGDRRPGGGGSRARAPTAARSAKAPEVTGARAKVDAPTAARRAVVTAGVEAIHKRSFSPSSLWIFTRRTPLSGC